MSDEEKTRDPLIAELQSLRRKVAQYAARGQNCPQTPSSEERYCALFEDAPVALWEEDFSETKALLDQLRRQGVSDFHAYFTQHPEVMETCMLNVKVLCVNRATLALFGAQDLPDLLERLPQTFTEHGLMTFQHALASLAEGRPLFEEETTMRTLQGELRYVLMRSFVSPADVTFSDVIVTMVDITEQKHAEEKLRESEEKFRSFIEQSYDGMRLVDADGVILVWNQGMEHMTGLKQAEVLGRFIWDVIFALTPEEKRSPALYERIKSRSFEVCTTGSTPWLQSPAEYELQQSDGTRRIVQTTVFPITTGRGLLIGSVIRDMTQIKRAEAALRENKERLVLALNVAQMGYWRIDCATNEVEWSNGHERLFGISLDEFGGTLDDVQRCVHPDDRDMGMRNLQRALEGNGDFINTYRVIYPNGDIHWLHSHGYVYRDAQGRPDHIFGITQDITARKHAEEKLRESEEKFRLIAENTSDGIIVFEQEKIVYTSPAYNRMMGVPEHSVNGLGPAEIAALIHPDDCERIFTNIYAAIAQKRDDLRYAYRTTTGTGKLIWREDHARFLYDQEGRHQKSYVVCRDITERVKSQEEARQREQRIQRANKLASLGVLVSGIAHEINNPNNFISLNISTLRKYLADFLPLIDAYVQERQAEEFAGLPYPEFRKELVELVEDIDYGSQRIKAIVSNLREYSYQSAERQWKWVEIPCVIEKAYLLCQGKIRKTVASFKAQFPELLEPVYTDPDALEQIVVNLLINAAQAMDKPDSHVVVCVTANTPTPEHVQIEIRDNGCGIEQARFDKIFDPFYTTKPLGEGIGLGLYICHNLLAGIGGKLEIESQPGIGSIFRILLTRAAPVCTGRKEVTP